MSESLIEAPSQDWDVALREAAESVERAAEVARGDAIRLAHYESEYRRFQALVVTLNPEQALFLLDRSEHLESVQAERDRLKREVVLLRTMAEEPV